MNEYINLDGVWKLDGYGDIKIPGTTDEAKYSNTKPELTANYLYRPYPWLGKAKYTREIDIPLIDGDDEVFFEIERTRHTYLYIDDEFVGECGNLLTKHIYNLTGKINEGTHKLAVVVNNNVHECGEYPDNIFNAHQFTDNTQTNWNGMLGNVRLVIKRGLQIDIEAVTLKDDKKFNITLKINRSNAKIKLNLDGETYFEDDVCTKNGKINIEVPFKGGEKFWNEHDPYRYNLVLEAICGDEKCTVSKMQGFRYLSVSGKKILLNGKRVFLRGKHDACVFPLTGYAPMTVEEWIKVFEIVKSYGINHYRCHTWCPPEAAYEAADICGIYFQAELPFFCTTFEKDEISYKYAVSEGIKVINEYASHPSFIVLSIGNELRGNRDALKDIISCYKNYRDDILYTQGSNNFLMHQYPIENEDVFISDQIAEDDKLYPLRASFAHCDMPSLGHFQQKEDKGTANTYSAMSVTKPIISHETGEYQVFPDYDEIQKYTGVTRAENLKYFKNLLDKKGLGNYYKKFSKASGHVAMLGYREEIEALMRSEDMSGFQILDLQDFPGQGTALVGILDSFMDSKGIISPENWRKFCNHTVILAVFDKYVYRRGENFKADIYVYNYCGCDISGLLSVTLGDFKYSEHVEICDGGTRFAFSVSFEMPKKNGEHILKLSLGNVCNDYKLYVYGNECENTVKTVYSKDLTEDILRENESIIVIASDMDDGVGIEGFFATDFWCWPMFENINSQAGLHAPGTLGLLIKNEHPALGKFKCETHSDNRWREIVNYSKSVILDGTEIEPIIRSIDNIARNHSLGMLFEVCVSGCKVLVCGSDLVRLKNTNPAAESLYAALDAYASSKTFKPENSVDFETFSSLLNRKSGIEAEKGDFSMFFAGDSNETL